MTKGCGSLGCGSLGCGPLGDSQTTCLDPLEFLLKSFGVSSHGFNLASKIFNDDQSERYEQGIMDFEVPSSMFVPLTMAAIVNLAASIWGLVEIFRGSNNVEGLFVQMFIAGFGIVNCIQFMKP